MSKENENELKLYFKHDTAVYPSMKKELFYDIDKDKYFLLDNEIHKIYPSNFFGRKKIRISNSNLGKLSYKERLQKDLIEKLEHKLDGNLYAPRNKYFEGFSQIPRPLEHPFFNFRNDKKIQDKKIIQSKLDMIKFIKNKGTFLNDNKYKDVISRNINSNKQKIKSLNYYSNSVADSINYKNKKIIQIELLKLLIVL